MASKVEKVASEEATLDVAREQTLTELIDRAIAQAKSETLSSQIIERLEEAKRFIR